MNPKLAKLVLKGVTSAAGAIVIGYIMKAEKKLDQRITEHFAEEEPKSETQED